MAGTQETAGIAAGVRPEGSSVNASIAYLNKKGTWPRRMVSEARNVRTQEIFSETHSNVEALGANEQAHGCANAPLIVRLVCGPQVDCQIA